MLLEDRTVDVRCLGYGLKSTKKEKEEAVSAMGCIVDGTEGMGNRKVPTNKDFLPRIGKEGKKGHYFILSTCI